MCSQKPIPQLLIENKILNVISDSILEEELQIIKRRSSIPIWKFGDKKKMIFIKIIKKVLLSNDKSLTKAFLISRIDVKPTEATISGSNIQMLNAISKTKMGTSIEVPTFVSMWR